MDYDREESFTLLAEEISDRLANRPAGSHIVVMCIGTDRSTGDALGPLVGAELLKRKPGLSLFGTLDEPVHAVNLAETIQHIETEIVHPYVVAVDACLGQLSHVGKITLSDGPLRPGAGVHKKLPPVGHMHITGTVNVGGFMEYFVLQNTRLSVVFRMANVIADALGEALCELAPQSLTVQSGAARSSISRLGALLKGH